MRSLFVQTLAAAAAAATMGPISLQLHSYNDFRQWPQALAKAEASAIAASNGTDSPLLLMLKLDPQYLNATACARFTRAQPDARGCFVFNHDTATGASARPEMNTSSDFLHYIGSPDLSRWTRGGAQVSLTVSLCFKGCGAKGCPCNAATEPLTADWLSLADDWIASINSAISQQGLSSLHMLLDGDGNPLGGGGCLAQRWRPWRTLYISGDIPSDAFSSNNTTLGYDRVAVLNEPQGGSFSVAAALGFGKFAGLGVDGSPYIDWEPSDGNGISSTVQQYAASPGAPNPAGLRFAINIDPAQLDVYAAAAGGLSNVTSGGWNEVIASAASSPRTVLLPQLLLPSPTTDADAPTTTAASSPSLLLSAWEDDGANATVAFVVRFMLQMPSGGPGQPLQRVGFGQLPIAPASARPSSWSLSPLLLANGTTAVLYSSMVASSFPGPGADNVSAVVMEQVLFLTLEDAAGPTFGLIAIGAPSPPPGTVPTPLLASVAAFSSSVTNCGAGAVNGTGPEWTGLACRVWAWAPSSASAPGCLLMAAVFAGPPLGPYAIRIPPLCVASASPGSGLLGNLTSAQLDGVSIHAAPFVVSSSPAHARLGVALVYSGIGYVFGATACALDVTDGGEGGINDPACWSGTPSGATLDTTPLMSHVGTAPAVVVVPQMLSPHGHPTLLVLEVHTNASCPNNEVTNKAADAGLCDVHPVHHSGAPYLSYNFGPISAWGNQLLAAAPLARAGKAATAPWPGASACSLTVAHGSWGQGRAPSAALVPLLSGGFAAAVAVEVLGAGTLKDPRHCGAPTAAGVGSGTVALQGWALARGAFDGTQSRSVWHQGASTVLAG